MANKNSSTQELGTGKIGTLLWRLAMPAIAAQIINLLYNLVDRMYIGRIPGVGAMALTVVSPLVAMAPDCTALASMRARSSGLPGPLPTSKGAPKRSRRAVQSRAARIWRPKSEA